MSPSLTSISDPWKCPPEANLQLLRSGCGDRHCYVASARSKGSSDQPKAGCLCPLICRKQNPTKQVPVLIATLQGVSWGQENEQALKTVVRAKTLSDKVSQERLKKKTHLVKPLTSWMGWQMNDGCRWENGIPFKEKRALCTATRKPKVPVRGAGSRQCLSGCSLYRQRSWNKPSGELLEKRAKPRAASHLGTNLEEL